MGVSTDGILTYGLSFDDGDLDLEELCEQLGADFDGDQEGLSRLDDGDFADLAEELLEGQGLKLLLHCSGENPMYIIAPTSGDTCARRGYAQRIRKLPAPTESQKRRLKQLQANLGGELGVWLCSYWG